MTWRERLERRLSLAEGVRAFPYTDTRGKLTIGVGRNLTDRGLRHDEIELLLRNDVDAALTECERLPVWGSLSEARKLVLAEMCFNLGLPRLLSFRRMFAALRAGDYARAAFEMLNSKWKDDVGPRAYVLARAMEQDALPDL